MASSILDLLGESAATAYGIRYGQQEEAQKMIDEHKQRQLMEKAKELGLDPTKPDRKLYALAVDMGLMTPMEAAKQIASLNLVESNTERNKAETRKINETLDLEKRWKDLLIKQAELEYRIKQETSPFEVQKVKIELDNLRLQKELLEKTLPWKAKMAEAEYNKLAGEVAIIADQISKLNSQKEFQKALQGKELNADTVLAIGAKTGVLGAEDIINYFLTKEQLKEKATAKGMKVTGIASEYVSNILKTLGTSNLDVKGKVLYSALLAGAMAKIPNVFYQNPGLDPAQIAAKSIVSAFKDFIERRPEYKDKLLDENDSVGKQLADMIAALDMSALQEILGIVKQGPGQGSEESPLRSLFSPDSHSTALNPELNESAPPPTVNEKPYYEEK